MPVYNARQYVGRAIKSMLNQSFSDFRLIIVDDGSTDGSRRVIERYARRDPRIELISRPNTGIVGALNDALAIAEAPLVARMDGDDESLPSRLERQVEYLDAHRDCVAVSTWMMNIGLYGDPVGEIRTPLDHETIDVGHLRGLGGQMVHAAAMMRLGAIRQVGGYREECCWAEDLDLFLRLAEIGRLANIAEMLYRRQWHPQAVCIRHRAQQLAAARIAVERACERRGICEKPNLSELDERSAATPSPFEQLDRCGRRCLHRGQADLARRYAWRMIGTRPHRPEGWRLLKWAVIG
jgi:glycosyltransferase involved in cell wall biosynthesis